MKDNLIDDIEKKVKEYFSFWEKEFDVHTHKERDQLKIIIYEKIPSIKYLSMLIPQTLDSFSSSEYADWVLEFKPIHFGCSIPLRELDDLDRKLYHLARELSSYYAKSFSERINHYIVKTEIHTHTETFPEYLKRKFKEYRQKVFK